MNKLFVLLMIFVVGCGQYSSDDERNRSRTEPYIDIVEKEITLTYDVEEGGLYYRRYSGYIIDDSHPSLRVSCTITNTSEYGGTFVLYAKLSSQGDVVAFKASKFIQAGQTAEIVSQKEINDYTFQANVEVDSWRIKAPKRKIKKEVVKYRTVYE